MLRLFRKHAISIALGIVVFFSATMFSGIFFLDSMGGGAPSTQTVSEEQVIARLGDLYIQNKYYYSNLQNILSQYEGDGRKVSKLDPEQIELIKLSAFQKSVEYTLMLEGSKGQDIPVSKQDIKFALADVYKRFNISSKKELKVVLKSNGIKYKDFINEIKSELKVQKLYQGLQAQASVSDQDIQRKYRSLKLKHILITEKGLPEVDGETKEQTQARLQDKANRVYGELSSGLAFESAVQTYSEDRFSKERKGSLGWVSFGTLPKPLEDVSYELANNELSRPVRTMFGYHIIQKVGEKKIAKPKDFNVSDEKNELLSLRQSQLIQQFLQSVRGNKKLDVKDQEIIAGQAKLEGNLVKLKGAYQSQISKTPNSPIPHYLLGLVYLKEKDIKRAKNELLKADILGDLNPDWAVPQTNIQLAEIFRKEKLYKSANEQYKKAIDRAKADLGALEYLKRVFMQKKDQKRLKRIEKYESELQASLKNRSKEASN